MAITTQNVLRTREAASYLGLAVGTLANLRSAGQGPTYVKYGNAVVYRVADLDAYLEAHTVQAVNTGVKVAA